MGLESLEKKVADHYNKDHPQGQAAQPQQPAPPPQQSAQQQQAPPAAPAAPAPEQHHGSNIAKRLGGAAVFGAGATAGGDAVNGLINNL